MSRRGYKTAGDHPRPPFRLTSHAHFNDMALRIIGRPVALTTPLAPSAFSPPGRPRYVSGDAMATSIQSYRSAPALLRRFGGAADPD